MSYRLVVFDWDGTLMDSAGRIVHAIRAAAATAGLPARKEAVIRDFIGLGMAEAADRLYPGMPAADHACLAAACRDRYVRALADRPASLFDGVPTVLDELAAAGFLLAVATGKSRSGLQRDLADTAIGDHFVTTRTVSECGSKPSPQMVEDILDELGVRADEAIVVGDSLYDLQMAANAGVDALAVTWGVHDRERLADGTPLGWLDHIDQLPGWLLAARRRRSPPAVQ